MRRDLENVYENGDLNQGFKSCFVTIVGEECPPGLCREIYIFRQGFI